MKRPFCVLIPDYYSQLSILHSLCVVLITNHRSLIHQSPPSNHYFLFLIVFDSLSLLNYWKISLFYTGDIIFMEVARHWRIKHQRYALVGEICINCGETLFPARAVCPHCRGKIHRLENLKSVDEAVTVPVLTREPAGSYLKGS